MKRQERRGWMLIEQVSEWRLCQGTDGTIKKEIAQIRFKKKHIFLQTKKKQKKTC